MRNKGKVTTDFDKQIGARIKDLRQGSGWSRAQLAEKIGITRQQLAKNEAGVNRICPDRLRRLALVFNVTIGSIFNEEVRHLPRSRPKLSMEAVRVFNKLTEDQQNAIVTLMRTM